MSKHPPKLREPRPLALADLDRIVGGKVEQKGTDPFENGDLHRPFPKPLL